MNLLFSDGPIIACSTNANANSAIAVIRLSGFDSLEPYQPYFSTDFKKLKPRMATLSDLSDGMTKLDSVVLTYFKGPKSYNGENILELAVHGNRLNVERILTLFESKKLARFSAPGEFTYRALKNSKMSLSQVEGLDLMLNAQSEFALGQGLSLISGDLNDSFQKLFNTYLKLKTSVEMHFDFLEDMGEEQANKLFRESLADFSSQIGNLAKRASTDNSSLMSPEIVLVGETNAGKSSLFNQFLGFDRSIVSPIKGTTRDFISEYIKLKGTTYKLVDTAGLRAKTDDEIEKMGMKLSLEKLTKAFFKILVINPLETFSPSADYLKMKFDMVVFTHKDDPSFDKAMVEFMAKHGSIEPLKNLGPIEPIMISTLSGPIEPKLESLISDKFAQLLANSPILLERQRLELNKLYLIISEFNELSITEPDMAILSHELNNIGQSLSELIGVIAPDDVLDNLFSNFCIGK